MGQRFGCSRSLPDEGAATLQIFRPCPAMRSEKVRRSLPKITDAAARESASGAQTIGAYDRWNNPQKLRRRLLLRLKPLQSLWRAWKHNTRRLREAHKL